ncbi:SMP-30/gluconolactonase/LRE family protein [Chelativorans xinjiangense]|uniref:SMP-30/gluconolactonase/LRE family protein n=1 Tax=Chelativorans xinjiangense TaxID=2681485 RepID=UPI00135B7891|nr:SMP-30/gluconolactonase/LRE family protein [Chelativorans xinjiangense]
MRLAHQVLHTGDIVGESIIWSPGEEVLWWVDIVGRRIHRYSPSAQEHRFWPTPELVSSIGLRRGGGLIVGLRQRVAFWRPGGAFETFAVPEPDLPQNRLNEGVVAPDGSFWCGTMQNNVAEDGSPKEMTARTGAIYRITPDGTVTRMTDREFGITNTMVWTDDGRFVTADTLKNRLYQYDVLPSGLGPRRDFGQPLDRGLPDGSTRDTDGRIYNARVVDGAAIARLSPDGGLEDYFDLPCRAPTSCTFGGPDLSTLYVTSSRFGLSDDDIRTLPGEGALYALDVDAAGLPAPEFG